MTEARTEKVTIEDPEKEIDRALLDLILLLAVFGLFFLIFAPFEGPNAND